MIVGVCREIKKDEYRVGLTPSGAVEYIKAGHKIYIETGAGIGSGFTDQDYSSCGCIIASKEELFYKSEMIIKVKEPLPEEFACFREGQLLYTYLHLAANKQLVQFLLDRKITGIAYETVVDSDGSLPLLKPMSEIAGRLSVKGGPSI